jgi:hypothetical protein
MQGAIAHITNGLGGIALQNVDMDVEAGIGWEVMSFCGTATLFILTAQRGQGYKTAQSDSFQTIRLGDCGEGGTQHEYCSSAIANWREIQRDDIS